MIKSTNKIKVAAIAGVMVLSMGLLATPVHAATNVTIEAKATTVNVTVPTTLPIVLNADGTNTVPTNFTVTNNSALSSVYVQNMKFDGAKSDWSVSSANMTTLAADTKALNLQAGKAGALKAVAPSSGTTAKVGNAAFGANDIVIAPKANQVINFGLTRTAFTSNEATIPAYDLTIDFAFK